MIDIKTILTRSDTEVTRSFTELKTVLLREHLCATPRLNEN